MVNLPVSTFPIWELDVLIASMLLIALVHAAVNGWRQIVQVIISLLLALLVEQSSIWIGGTHCHREGILMVSPCSSLNSVLYYVPWIYACTWSANRLSNSDIFRPFVMGMLMLGFCCVYEMLGPTFGWWQYGLDLEKDGTYIIAPFSQVANFTGWPQITKRGFETTQLAATNLAERWHGMPVMAPLFHFALGFGYEGSSSIAKIFFKQKSVELHYIIVFLLCVPTALLWGGVTNFFVLFGISRTICVLIILGLSGCLSFYDATTSKAPTTRDILLFLIPLINHTYFIAVPYIHPETGGDDYPSVSQSLYLSMCVIANCSIIAHARACGLLGYSRPILPKSD